MMRTLHIIMPMAGEGVRFLNVGCTTPKPLILHKGRMLFQRALNSLDAINAPKKYSFIVRHEHIRDYQIDKALLALYPNAKIFSVSKTTRGAVETCLIAKSDINNEDSILILDCDLEFYSLSFNKHIVGILARHVSEVNGGALVSFESTSDKFSYAEVLDGNLVKRTAEKKVISNHALAGAYFFSSSEGFFYAANRLLSDNNLENSEYYISLLFNYLIRKGETVVLTKVDEYYSYGTPSELNAR